MCIFGFNNSLIFIIYKLVNSNFKAMDNKELEIITELHNRIITKLCNESDIYSILILLRCYAKEKTAVKEFGDFIAHREKDRGFINEYLIRTKEILDNLGKRNELLVIKNVFSFEEIKTSFNEILSKLNLQNFNDEIVRIIIVFIISLLQDVNIIDKKKNSVGKLVFSISKNEIVLLGRVYVQNKTFVVFPVLSVKNWFEDKVKSKDPVLIDKIIKVVLVNYEIKIKLTDFDLK